MSDTLRFNPDDMPEPSREIQGALARLFGRCHTCYFAMHCFVAKENAKAVHEERITHLAEKEVGGTISFDDFLARGTKEANDLYAKELLLIRFEQSTKNCPGPTPDANRKEIEAADSMICNNPLAEMVLEQEIDFTPPAVSSEESDL